MDVSVLKTDVSVLKTEVSRNSGDIETLKSLTVSLRETSADLRSELLSLRIEMTERFDRVWHESERIRTEMTDGFAEVRSEMAIGFKALIQKDDRRFLDHEGRIRRLEARRRRTT
jgi:hypothetical protein